MVADEGLSQHDRLVVPIDADDVKVEQAEAICRVRVVADEHVLKTLKRFQSLREDCKREGEGGVRFL